MSEENNRERKLQRISLQGFVQSRDAFNCIAVHYCDAHLAGHLAIRPKVMVGIPTYRHRNRAYCHLSRIALALIPTITRVGRIYKAI